MVESSRPDLIATCRLTAGAADGLPAATSLVGARIQRHRQRALTVSYEYRSLELTTKVTAS